MERVGLWMVDADDNIVPLQSQTRVDLEERLEEMIVSQPEMLGEGVTLIGRQLRTDGGPLDLLGIDEEEGRLIVYELKRGVLPREALSQVIDYASWLDSRDFETLAEVISAHNPRGIERDFDDFGDWYQDRYGDDGFESLRPCRMVLVGLGIDPKLERMTEFLAEQGADISAITFQGFALDERLVLARTVEVSPDERSPSRRRTGRRSNPEERAEQFQAGEVFREAKLLILETMPEGHHFVHTFANGYNFVLRPTDRDASGRWPAWFGIYVRTRGETGRIGVYIRRPAMAACPDELETLLAGANRLGFLIKQPPSGDYTRLIMDADGFSQARTLILDFLNAAVAAWRRDYDLWNSPSDPDSSRPKPVYSR